MGTKAEETAPGATGCLAKAGDDEPLFILRAKDMVAPGVVRVWAHYARGAGAPEEKVQEALAAADRMEQWQKANGRKVPD
jgi:hypothetical protein